MSPRTATVTTASVLLVVLVCVAILLPVPYVTLSPGPTRDVLALGQGAPVISIEGAQTYPSEGSLRLTTVSVTSPDESVGIGTALQAWISPEQAVVPRDAFYPDSESAEESEQESTAQMVDSQEVAAAAALRQLGRDVPEHVEVVSVDARRPADGVLEVGDLIVGVDGTRTGSAVATVEAIQDRAVGDEVRLTVRRDGAVRVLSLPTVESEVTAGVPVVGIATGITYDLPVEVQIEIPGSIGGPSAGAVFALAIYDALTPGSLIGDSSVAGTGVIGANGRIGPIGGIQQKIAGAVEAGAEVFLVPEANCADAAVAPVDEDEIVLVEVADLRGAVAALEQLSADPEAQVPLCE